MTYPCSENLPGCRVLDHDGTDHRFRPDGFRALARPTIPVPKVCQCGQFLKWQLIPGVSPPFQKPGVSKFRAWQDDLIRARDTSSSQDRLSRSQMSS